MSKPQNYFIWKDLAAIGVGIIIDIFKKITLKTTP